MQISTTYIPSLEACSNNCFESRGFRAFWRSYCSIITNYYWMDFLSLSMCNQNHKSHTSVLTTCRFNCRLQLIASLPEINCSKSTFQSLSAEMIFNQATHLQLIIAALQSFLVKSFLIWIIISFINTSRVWTRLATCNELPGY